MTKQNQNTYSAKDAKSKTPMPSEGKAPSETLAETPKETPEEIGGPEGPEPTRYGDWERGGKCVDF